MGFFSSKKSDDSDQYAPNSNATVTAPAILGANPTPTPTDKSVVQVLRSRFYGRHKGKEREQPQPPSSFAAPNAASAAHTLSNANSAPGASSPLKRHAQAGPSILRTSTNTTTASPLPPPPHHDRLAPSTPAKRHSKHLAVGSTKDTPLPPVPLPLRREPSLRIRTTDSQHNRSQPSSPAKGDAPSAAGNASPGAARKATDTVTVTLAQRLNELAVANSEGLLNDDEYRLLRQNLFERFSSTAIVPSEEPLVPAARPRVRKGGPLPESRPNTMRPMSNFQVEVPRPSSVHSRNSMRSGMTDLFRRATGRRTASGSNDYSETSSVWSGTSTTSGFFRLPRVLSKKSSSSSIRTTASRTAQQAAGADTISISSRRTGGVERGADHLSIYSPSVGTRSAAGSLRRAVPPSSFRAVGADGSSGSSHKYVPSMSDDDGTPMTAQAIRQEILAVEAEARRLMDAFNGLELTTLTKSQRHHFQQGRLAARTADTAKSLHSYVDSMGDGRSQRRVGDVDGVSIRSGASVGTRSVYSARRAVRQKTSMNASLALSVGGSRPGSLHRKNSSSSMASEKRGGGRPVSMAPPVPALPASLGLLNGSTTSLGRSTGHLPMSVVPEDEDAVSVSGYTQAEEMEEVGAGEVEAEMEDIQRRREEVRQRYEAKLEYLRAKLKGAQLHEKLLRK